MQIITIGRNPGNKIVIQDPTKKVSGNHGEIKIVNSNLIYYKDISTNGTMVNGKIIHHTECQVQRGTPIVFPNNTPLDWNKVPSPSYLHNVKKEITIGKSPDNQIQLHSEKASRYHAILKISNDGKYYIYDQSLNGTLVNGNKIPKYQDYQVKRKDKIFFANTEQFDWKKISRTAPNPLIYALSAAVLLIIGVGSFFLYSFYSTKGISQKYDNAVCLIYNAFYLAYLDGSDTLYYIGADNNIIDFKNERYRLSDLEPIEAFGSGFFASAKGEIITNKHVAQPWEGESASEKELIKTQVGEFDTMRTGKWRFNPKIVDVPVIIGVFLNQSDMDPSLPAKNLIECNFIRSSPAEELDLALIQTKNKSLPPYTGFVKKSDIISNRKEINVDDEITIIGFPLAFDLALNNYEGKVKSTSTHGRVSKISDRYTIQYDAGSTHGASGSPVFNKNGKLIAVNYGIIEGSEAYNFGVIATHINDLMKE